MDKTTRVPTLDNILQDRRIPKLIKSGQKYIPEYGYRYQDGLTQNPRRLILVNVDFQKELDKKEEEKTRKNLRIEREQLEQSLSLMELDIEPTVDGKGKASKDYHTTRQRIRNLEYLESNDYVSKYKLFHLNIMSYFNLIFQSLGINMDFLRKSSDPRPTQQPSQVDISCMLYPNGTVVFEEDEDTKIWANEDIILTLDRMEKEKRPYALTLEEFKKGTDVKKGKRTHDEFVYTYLIGYNGTFISTGTYTYDLETDTHKISMTLVDSQAKIATFPKDKNQVPFELDILEKIFGKEVSRQINPRTIKDISKELENNLFSGFFVSNSTISIPRKEAREIIEERTKKEFNYLEYYQECITKLADSITYDERRKSNHVGLIRTPGYTFDSPLFMQMTNKMWSECSFVKDQYLSKREFAQSAWDEIKAKYAQKLKL